MARFLRLSAVLLRLTVRDTRAADVALLYAAATVVRRHQLPGDLNNVPGWESVAKALDPDGRAPGQRADRCLAAGPIGRGIGCRARASRGHYLHRDLQADRGVPRSCQESAEGPGAARLGDPGNWAGQRIVVPRRDIRPAWRAGKDGNDLAPVEISLGMGRLLQSFRVRRSRGPRPFPLPPCQASSRRARSQSRALPSVASPMALRAIFECDLPRQDLGTYRKDGAE
jgi:hypothetical protein